MGDPLGPYKADPLINRQWQDDADHDVLSMNAAYQAWSIGVNVAREKTLKNTALRYVLERSAEESAIAIQELLLVDMTNARGVEVARALQARAIRYRELIEWLEEAVQIGNEAAQQLQEHDKDQILSGANGSALDGDFDGSEPVQPDD